MHKTGRKPDHTRNSLRLASLVLIVLVFLSTRSFADQTGNPHASAEKQELDFEQSVATCERLVRGQRLREAIPHARAAYEIAKGIYGPAHEKTLASSCNYGRLLLATGDIETARPILQQNIEQYENRYGRDALELVDPLMDLAHASVAARESTEHTRYFDRAIEIASRAKGKDSILLASLNLEAGISLLKADDLRGLDYVIQARSIYQSRLGDSNPSTGVAAFWVGKGYFASQQYAEAVASLNAALDAFHHPIQPGNPLTLSSHALLVEAYQRLGEPENATVHCQAIGRLVPWKPGTQKPLYVQKPKYPAKEKLHGREGQVLLEFVIDKEGFVKEPKVLKLRGSHQFSEAALEAIQNWRYAPRFENGVALDTPGVKYLMKFRLHD